MKTIALVLVALALAVPLTTGGARAFSTSTEDNTKPDGSQRYADPDETVKADRDRQTPTKTYQFGQGSTVTYGIQMRSANRPGFAGFGRAPDASFGFPSSDR